MVIDGGTHAFLLARDTYTLRYKLDSFIARGFVKKIKHLDSEGKSSRPLSLSRKRFPCVLNVVGCKVAEIMSVLRKFKFLVVRPAFSPVRSSSRAFRLVSLSS